MDHLGMEMKQLVGNLAHLAILPLFFQRALEVNVAASIHPTKMCFFQKRA